MWPNMKVSEVIDIYHIKDKLKNKNVYHKCL